jgi:hypothetical protein
MPLPPLSVTLTHGQQVEVLKRFRTTYADELAKLEQEMTEILTANAEADFMSKYLGEQPEVKNLRERKDDLETKEKRRQYLGMILERLDAVLPKQAPVPIQPPITTPPAKSGGLKRF